MIGNGGFGDVSIQSGTNPLFQYVIQRELKTDITLTESITLGSPVVNVSSGHGFTAADGEILSIYEFGLYIQAEVVSVNVDAITLELPVYLPFTTNAKVVRGNANLNIATAYEAKLSLYNFIDPIDISGAKIIARHNAAGDLSKFMGITALTNGWYLTKTGNIFFNFGNYRNNTAFEAMGWTVSFPDKAPSGEFATQLTVDFKSMYDANVVRLDPENNDGISVFNRDDLSSLEFFRMYAYGSFTLGE
jgi:hypothetical protein